MDKIMQWFSMGGYSTYVWSAYGLALLTFILTGVNAKQQKKKAQQQVQRWMKSER